MLPPSPLLLDHAESLFFCIPCFIFNTSRQYSRACFRYRKLSDGDLTDDIYNVKYLDDMHILHEFYERTSHVVEDEEG